MMDIPLLFRQFINDQSIHLLQVRDTGSYQFKNQDNRDFFTLIEEFYNNNGKMDLDIFRKKYPDMEIYWETLAALGAATGSMELMEYAKQHEGGRVNMCSALENLKQEGRQEGRKEGRKEGRQEGMIKGMITAYRELNVANEIIIKKLQQKFHLSEKEIHEYLNQDENNF